MSTILHTNQILGNGITKCWDWNEKLKNYIVTEVPTAGGQEREVKATHIYQPGAPEAPSTRGGRRSILDKLIDGRKR